MQVIWQSFGRNASGEYCHRASTSEMTDVSDWYHDSLVKLIVALRILVGNVEVVTLKRID